jgi:hypothetical protein
LDVAIGNQWVPALSIPLPHVRGILFNETYETDQYRQRLVDQVLSLRGTRPDFKNVRLSHSSNSPPSLSSPRPPSQNHPRSPANSSAARFLVSCPTKSKPHAVGTRVAVLFLRARLQPAVFGIYARGHPPWLAWCLRPLAPLYLSASGDLGIPDGFRATRKP